MSQKKYRIRGMDCAEEVNALKATVGKLPGIDALDFNLIDGVMTVQQAGTQVDDESIRIAVRQAGLEAQAVDEKNLPQGGVGEGGWWWNHGRSVMCWASGALVAAGFLAHLLLHGNLLHVLTGGEGMEHHEYPLSVILLYSAAALTGGWYFIPKSWHALRRFRADMNLLMTMAVIGAMGIGQWFEAATVSFLFSFSLLLESWSVGHARQAIRSLVNLAPPMARYICPHDGDIMEKPVEDVPLGATVLVRPGERIPLDGILTKGRTAVNQAPITGESMPVAKEEGDEVFAGSINEEGAIEFRATKPAADTTLARIIRMVEQAQARRAPVEQWVETFARYYTPAMIAVAFLVAIVPPLFGGEWGRWFYEALVMLVIACPCALVISTPVSIVAALTAAAKAGVLIKGGAFLEAVGRVTVVALDKTGTLTRGRPEVQLIVPWSGHTQAELLARVAALEMHSDHPLAQAVLRKARMEKVEPLVAQEYRVLKGRGDHRRPSVLGGKPPATP